jgi:hypothetical protein
MQNGKAFGFRPAEVGENIGNLNIHQERQNKIVKQKYNARFLRFILSRLDGMEKQVCIVDDA